MNSNEIQLSGLNDEFWLPHLNRSKDLAGSRVSILSTMPYIVYIDGSHETQNLNTIKTNNQYKNGPGTVVFKTETEK